MTRPPLTQAEAFAARFERNPGRLLELARATGNKELVSIARGMLDRSRGTNRGTPARPK